MKDTDDGECKYSEIIDFCDHTISLFLIKEDIFVGTLICGLQNTYTWTLFATYMCAGFS